MNVRSPEHREFVDDLRSTLRSALSRNEPSAADPASWDLLAGQMGVAGILVPEAQGGLGLGASELAAVAEEIGASLANGPFLSHAVAAVTLLRAADSNPADPLIDDLLTDAAGNTRRLAVVRAPTGSIVAQGETGSVLLTGSVPAVLDAPGADVLLVECTAVDRVAICIVDPRRSGVTIAERSALDPSRSIGSVAMESVPGTLLIAGDSARHALETSLRWARLALAADQLGIARRSLAVTVDYAKIRTQFGAVIGSFQAVKHRCADVLLEIELAAALIEQAAVALDAMTDPQDLVSTAALQASSAALLATDAAIQLHGGIGFTWEHPAHRYYRRARSNASLLGSAQALRDAVAASVGL